MDVARKKASDSLEFSHKNVNVTKTNSVLVMYARGPN